MLSILREPWPWYVGGPLIGLMVPALLWLGNHRFGMSPALRHVCAATFPANLAFLRGEIARAEAQLHASRVERRDKVKARVHALKEKLHRTRERAKA